MKTQNKVVSFRASEELVNSLKARSEKQNVSVSQVIIRAIKGGLSRFKK